MRELTTRAIPSALGQSYRNLEVVVIGDGSPPEMAEAIAALGDPRVTFHNLAQRDHYHRPGSPLARRRRDAPQ